MNQTNRPTDNFFMPDLCAIQPVFFLVLLAQLLATSLEISDSGFSQFSWSQFGLRSVFLQWITLTSAALLCISRKYLCHLQQQTAAAICFAIILVDTSALSIAAHSLLGWIGTPQQLAFEVLEDVIVAAIIGGLILRYLYVQQQLRNQQTAELSARLQALQSRIRPHFLFNSMNIIASLIATDPDKAEQVVEDLSQLFRASLDEVSQQIPLTDELELCRRYLDIESLRLGERLKVEWQCDDYPREIKIPQLTLQPVLENAIYHGIQPLAEGGTILIGLQCAENLVKLTVTNPLASSSGVAHKRGNRMALANIHARLLSLYGEQAYLETRPDGEKFITTISYPYYCEK